MEELAPMRCHYHLDRVVAARSIDRSVPGYFDFNRAAMMLNALNAIAAGYADPARLARQAIEAAGDRSHP